MERYNYFEAVKEDVRNYIEENKDGLSGRDRDEVEEELNDELFITDSVTGNASGSYTFNYWTAEEYLCHNLDLAQEAYEEFGYDGVDLGKGAEVIDVTIRCYLLSRAIGEVLDECWEDWFEKEEEFDEDEPDEDIIDESEIRELLNV